MVAELSALRYRYSAQGKIQIESKDELKPRLGRSPDLADACLIGFPEAIPELPGIFIGRAGSSRSIEVGGRRRGLRSLSVMPFG